MSVYNAPHALEAQDTQSQIDALQLAIVRVPPMTSDEWLTLTQDERDALGPDKVLQIPGGPAIRAKNVRRELAKRAKAVNDTEAPKRALTHGAVLAIMRNDARWRGNIRLNEFTNDVELHMPEPERWTDVCTTRTVEMFGEQTGREPTHATIEHAVKLIATENRYNPVRDWLDSLKWDGTPRIDRLWADYFGAEHNEYCAATSSKFMIGAVARIYKPGCKRDEMPILEQGQGAFKSTCLKALFGDDWFSDTWLDIGNKDAMAALPGRWCFEFAELASIRGANVDKLKGFLSSSTDRYRPAYGRHAQDVKRQQVFIGTVNPDGAGYLHDETGNRRFWPIKCGTGNPTAIARDREQLFAEAVTRFNSGAQWWLTESEAALARGEQEEREAEDPWFATVDQWLEMLDTPQLSESAQQDRVANSDRPMALAERYAKENRARECLPRNWATCGITTAAILESAIGKDPRTQSKFDESRLGIVLKALKWTKGRDKRGPDGKRPYLWFPPAEVVAAQPGLTAA